MENKFLNKNEVIVVGTLVENGLEIKESRQGQTYIQGDIKVKSVIEGKKRYLNSVCSLSNSRKTRQKLADYLRLIQI